MGPMLSAPWPPLVAWDDACLADLPESRATSVSEHAARRRRRRGLKRGARVPFPFELGTVVFFPTCRSATAKTALLIAALVLLAAGMLAGVFVLAPLVLPWYIDLSLLPPGAWERARHRSAVGCAGLLLTAGAVALHAINTGVLSAENAFARDADADSDDDAGASEAL